MISKRFQVAVILCLSVFAALASSIAAEETNSGSPWVDIRSYGGKGDGVSDNTPALNAAAAAAFSSKRRQIYFPEGKYLFNSKPSNFAFGVTILCPYSPGSAFSFGTHLVANYNEDTPTDGFLSWDGSEGGTSGTGGGIDGCAIWKQGGKRGGAAIKLSGKDQTHRAGFMRFSNIIVTGEGTWDYDFYADGTGITVPSSPGVRDIFISNAYFFQSIRPTDSIRISGVTHFYWTGGALVPGGVPAVGMTITGGPGESQRSNNIYLIGVEIVGSLSLDYVDTFSAGGSSASGNFSSTSNTTNSSFDGIIRGKIANNGGVTLATNKGLSAAEISSGRVSNADVAGQLQLSSGSASYRFTGTYSAAPVCVCSDTSRETAPCNATVTSTGLTVTGKGMDVVNYICIARN